MSDCIYVIKSGKEFVKLDAAAYDKEDDFQALLEQFPSLLSGELINPESPRRWLLVGREVGVPDSDDAPGRWSLDHLFVDQDGMPTLVEVKRQSDTRLRREVVGQMLDYAANAAAYWPAELLQQEFGKTCQKKGKEPSKELQEFLGNPAALEGKFWQGVAARLADGDMRLIFFADRVGSELQRIVEFLNEQMRLTEVLALEVRRYTGGDLSTHIPRVMGLSASANLSKAGASSPRRKWTEPDFVAAAGLLPNDASAAIAKVLAFSRTPGWERRFGTGSVDGSLSVVRPTLTGRSLFTVWTTGNLTLQLGWLDDAEGEKPKRERVRDGLAQIGRDLFGLQLPEDLGSYYPSVSREAWVPKIDEFLQRAANLVAEVETSFE